MGWAVERNATAEAAEADAASGRSELEAMKADAQARLNATQWAIELLPLSESKSKYPLTDTLRFAEGKITSEVLSSREFPTSNYTLTIEKQSIPVWQTMQTKPGSKKEVVFWRGELHGDRMRGVMSRQLEKGKSESFSFAGTRLASAPPAAQSEEVPAAGSVDVPEVAQETDSVVTEPTAASPAE